MWFGGECDNEFMDVRRSRIYIAIEFPHMQRTAASVVVHSLRSFLPVARRTDAIESNTVHGQSRPVDAKDAGIATF